MSKLSVTLKDDNGRDCVIENIRTFQKHLIMFHKSGVSIHDENGHYFTVNDSFREMVDGLLMILVFESVSVFPLTIQTSDP